MTDPLHRNPFPTDVGKPVNSVYHIPRFLSICGSGYILTEGRKLTIIKMLSETYQLVALRPERGLL